MRRRYIFLLVLFLCLILIFVIYPTDEKQIKKIINAGEKAVKAEDLAGVMKHISYNYMDDHGNSYLQLKNTLQTVFKYVDDIEVEKDIIEILVEKNSAEVVLSVSVLASEGEDRGYIIGDAVRAETVKVFFEKSPHKWLITRVEGLFSKVHGGQGFK